MELVEEVNAFLSEWSEVARLETPQGLTALACGSRALVLPVPVRSRSAEEAFRVNALVRLSLDFLMTSFPETKVVMLPEDMWRARPEMMRPRLLAQIGRFRSIFARNTSARRITGPEAAEFLKKWHTYSDAASRYRYGLFLGGTLLVAVATFSSARTWQKQEGIVRSYEWVRYASLPDVRVVGGMGKLLKTFVREVGPDDVMSYADLEWTDGEVYDRLGFREEGLRGSVLFSVNEKSWERKALTCDMVGPQGSLYHVNLGSRKYRLKVENKDEK